MRAVQIALLVIMIQIGMAIVTATGFFTGTSYENILTGFSIPSNASSLSEAEQVQVSINVMNTVFDTLTWGWIKQWFEPFYSIDSGVKSFVDAIVLLLRTVSFFIIGIAFIEFVRNRINILGSGGSG